jgi:hypothetical protein
MADVNLKGTRSKEKVKKYIEAEIKKLFTGVLDYAEVAIDSKERWKVLRSRILKLSNETIREIFRELDARYAVSYIAPAEDVIVINQQK